MKIYKYLKKYFKGVILMLLVFNYSYSAIMPENDWKDKNLKGKVKTIISNIEEYDYSGKVENTRKIITNFNEQGYVIDETHYINGRISNTYKNKYDKNGLCIESNDYTGRKWFHSYEYDKNNGNLIEIKKPEIRNKYEKTHKKYEKNSYDKNGRKINDELYTKDEEYQKDFELLSSYTYIYDNKGVLIEIRDNKYFSNSMKFTYDYKPNGEYLRTGKAAGKMIQQYYDKNGIEKEYKSTIWISRDTEPRVDQHLIIKTKLDNHGNIIEETEIRVEVTNKKTGEYKEESIRKKIINTYEYYN